MSEKPMSISKLHNYTTTLACTIYSVTYSNSHFITSLYLLYLQWPLEPSHEIMVLFVLSKLILQTRMRSHPMGFVVGPFVYFHTSCVRTAKTLAKLRRCTGSPEPSLVEYVISTIISWAGSNLHQSNSSHWNYENVFVIKQDDGCAVSKTKHGLHLSLEFVRWNYAPTWMQTI